MPKSRPIILIPMTGNGSRFLDAGFSTLKPFIKVHGTPIIEWVTRMFPGSEEDLHFICRKDHLDKLPYAKKILYDIAPKGNISALEQWNKQGPVCDILSVANTLDPERPVLVCYCDFFMVWDYDQFLRLVSEKNVDGAIPCYSGFQPHFSRPKNVYASCLTNNEDNLIEIREKFSWTEDKSKSRHSPGVYYFKSAKLMSAYFNWQVNNCPPINNEHYVSIAYNRMVEDGLKIWCPINSDYFCQWGTPQDLGDYNFWTNSILGIKQ